MTRSPREPPLTKEAPMSRTKVLFIILGIIVALGAAAGGAYALWGSTLFPQSEEVKKVTTEGPGEANEGKFVAYLATIQLTDDVAGLVERGNQFCADLKSVGAEKATDSYLSGTVESSVEDKVGLVSQAALSLCPEDVQLFAEYRQVLLGN